MHSPVKQKPAKLNGDYLQYLERSQLQDKKICRQSLMQSTQGIFHQNHGRNSDFTEQAFKLEDNYLYINSGRKSARSNPWDEPEPTNKTDSNVFRRNPAWPRTDHSPNLSQYRDREDALPNMRIKKLHKAAVEA